MSLEYYFTDTDTDSDYLGSIQRLRGERNARTAETHKAKFTRALYQTGITIKPLKKYEPLVLKFTMEKICTVICLK